MEQFNGLRLKLPATLLFVNHALDINDTTGYAPFATLLTSDLPHIQTLDPRETMLNQIPMDKPDPKDWQVESLRLTAFPSAAPQLTAANWWQDLVGEQPETRVTRSKEGLYQDEGRVDDTKLILGVRPMRIDWLAVPNDPQDKFVIGPFRDSLDSFLKLITPWFKISPPTKRLAFGAVLMLPVEDRKAGYILAVRAHDIVHSEGSRHRVQVRSD